MDSWEHLLTPYSSTQLVTQMMWIFAAADHKHGLLFVYPIAASSFRSLFWVTLTRVNIAQATSSGYNSGHTRM